MNELNLENISEIRQEIEDKITEGALEANTFDRLQTLVETNMWDSFNRFRMTIEYRNYKEEKDAKEELLKKKFDKDQNLRKSTRE